MSGIDYTEETKKLRELSDTRLGGEIIHQEDEKGNVTIIRDMRGATGNGPRLGENYLIQAIEYIACY